MVLSLKTSYRVNNNETRKKSTVINFLLEFAEFITILVIFNNMIHITCPDCGKEFSSLEEHDSHHNKEHRIGAKGGLSHLWHGVKNKTSTWKDDIISNTDELVN